MLGRRGEISRFAIPAHRNVRKLVTDALGKVFARGSAGDASTTYHWSAAELDAVFEVAVWPSLELLPHESAVSPTALLRLLLVWSDNPRYFPLLVKVR